MSYFPRALMPSTVKEDATKASGDSLIQAKDYNLHDEEIRAIESWLGVLNIYPRLGEPKQAPFYFQTESMLEQNIRETKPTDLIGRINSLINSVNLLSNVSGISLQSGYYSSAYGRTLSYPMPFVELSNTPSATDTVIHVNNDLGLLNIPGSGIITIPNSINLLFSGPSISDAPNTKDTTVAEWIRYSSISAHAFEGCERGYLGTTIGKHEGVDLTHYRPDIYECKYNLGQYLGGTKSEVIRQLMYGGYINFQKDGLGEVVASTADSLGLLGTRNNGRFYYFQSKVSGQHYPGQLTQEEAESLFSALLEVGIFEIVSGKTQSTSVPVFIGKLSLSYSPSYAFLGGGLYMESFSQSCNLALGDQMRTMIQYDMIRIQGT